MKKKLMIIFLAAAVFFSGCGKSGVENKTGKKPEALVEQKEANKTHTNK